MNEKQNHCNGNAGIGDIERGPWMGKPNMQIEKQKIDYVPVKKTIGKISQDPGQQERKRHILPTVNWSPSHEEGQNNQQRDRRNCDKESIVVPKRTKRRAGVRDVNQIEEIRYHDARPIGANEPQDQLFRPLVERVERQRNEKDELHGDFNRSLS
jgi:hypothetical protein